MGEPMPMQGKYCPECLRVVDALDPTHAPGCPNGPPHDPEPGPLPEQPPTNPPSEGCCCLNDINANPLCPVHGRER